jgi:LysR family transcriptional regulator, benzoate and cis,cis-muconate-responsive activator of ben and cat genes
VVPAVQRARSEDDSGNDTYALRMDIEVRHLSAMVALADHGTHTAAAAALHVTQPTLTRTVRQLERIYGLRLVESGSAELTVEGRAVVERARRVLAELAALDRDLSGHGSVRLGFAWLLPDEWFREVRILMDTKHITIEIQRLEDPLAALVAGDVDAALHRNALLKLPDGISTALIASERRVLAVSRLDHALADCSEIRWDALPNRPVIVNTMSGSTTADFLPRTDPERRIVECHNFDEWLELVAADAGIGIVPDISARRVTHPDIRYLPIPDAPPSQVGLAWRSTPPPSRVTRAFLDIAITVGRAALAKYQTSAAK